MADSLNINRGITHRIFRITQGFTCLVRIDLSDALKHRVNSHLGNLAERYFDKALQAQVTFSKARSFFTCDINVRTGSGLVLRGEGEAADANGAFDDAAEHIAKRLRRYNRRVTSHTRGAQRQATAQSGRTYVLQPLNEDRSGCVQAQHQPDVL